MQLPSSPTRAHHSRVRHLRTLTAPSTKATIRRNQKAAAPVPPAIFPRLLLLLPRLESPARVQSRGALEESSEVSIGRYSRIPMACAAAALARPRKR